MYRKSVHKIGMNFIVCLLLIVEVFTLFLMYKSSNNKITNLATIDLKESINSDILAIMVEQSDGTYKESLNITWPTSGYTYNESLSGCIDQNGNKLDGVLTYDATNNIATVDTRTTSYCYLYFSLPPNLYELCEEYSSINTCSQAENLANVDGIWESTLEDDGYRYVGNKSK